MPGLLVHPRDHPQCTNVLYDSTCETDAPVFWVPVQQDQRAPKTRCAVCVDISTLNLWSRGLIGWSSTENKLEEGLPGNRETIHASRVCAKLGKDE